MFGSPVKVTLVVSACRGVATVLCALGDVRHVLHREECARPGRLGKVVLGPRGLGGDVRIALQPVTCA